MSNQAYWAKRQAQMWAQLETDEKKLTAKLSKKYDAEAKSLEKQIAYYYKSFGEDNVIEYRRLMQQLPDDDKRLLIEQMEDFMLKYPEYADLMPVRESIYKLNRLEGMRESIYIQQMQIGAIEQKELEAHLKKQYERGYGAMAQELGHGTIFNYVNQDVLKKTINNKWCNGKNFSDRIWDNRRKLADYLNNDFSAAMARGDSYERCMSQLRKRFGKVSRRDMFNLIYTEGTYIMNEATITPFEEDFEEYEISIADERACPICKGLLGKRFKIKDRQPGVNFPPLHTCCRCDKTMIVPPDFVDRYVARHGGKTPETLPKLEDDGTMKPKKEEKERSEAYKYLTEAIKRSNIKHKEVGTLQSMLTSTDIIDRLAGGDKTKGSCSSLGFAYIGNRNGYDVIDFRGGKSQEFFSMNSNIKKMLELPNVKGSVIMVKKEAADTAEIINGLEYGKEYYLAVGKHAAIIRNTENGAEYLELQSRYENGWKPFNIYGSTVSTLCNRFGCRKSEQKVKLSSGTVTVEQSVILMDVDSFKENDEFKDILGYINTAVDKQKKGVSGGVK